MRADRGRRLDSRMPGEDRWPVTHACSRPSELGAAGAGASPCPGVRAHGPAEPAAAEGFLHLVMAFPSGRFAPGRDRAIVIAGYVIFTVATVPAMLFAGPHELGWDDCPVNVLLIRRDDTPATIALGVQALLYVALFIIVLVRLTLRAGGAPARSNGSSSRPSTRAGCSPSCS
jgi:hypothetical protein